MFIKAANLEQFSDGLSMQVPIVVFGAVKKRKLTFYKSSKLGLCDSQLFDICTVSF